MPAPLDPHEEYRALDERLRAGGLTPAERARWEELRAAGADRPVERTPGDAGFDVAAAAAVFRSSLPPEPDPWEAPVPRPTPVDWGRPAGRAGGGRADDDVPEASASDFEEVLDPTPPPADLPPLVLPIDSEPSFADAGIPPPPEADPVSLADLGPPAETAPARPTPPPPGAQALSSPLPPPPPLPEWSGQAAQASPAPSGAMPARTPPMSEVLGDAPALAPAAVEPAERSSFVAGEHRVVVHTIEGQVVRGIIADVDLDAREIPTVQPSGEVVRLPAAHLKAIFFMLAPGQPPPPAEGTRVRVVFGDGRHVTGLSPDFTPTAPGFFVIPVDVKSNTGRIWVFRDAARQVSVG